MPLKSKPLPITILLELEDLALFGNITHSQIYFEALSHNLKSVVLPLKCCCHHLIGCDEASSCRWLPEIMGAKGKPASSMVIKSRNQSLEEEGGDVEAEFPYRIWSNQMLSFWEMTSSPLTCGE